MGGLFAPALGGSLLATNMASSVVLLLSAIPAVMSGMLVVWSALTLRRPKASEKLIDGELSQENVLVSGWGPPLRRKSLPDLSKQPIGIRLTSVIHGTALMGVAGRGARIFTDLRMSEFYYM
jgi:hypothetical protein